MDIDIAPVDYKNIDILSFIEFVSDKLKSHILSVKDKYYKKIALTPSNQTNFKPFFDEMVPLMFFLRMQEGKYRKIEYMSGPQKGDAILDEKITIEITKAQNENKYLVTQDILSQGRAFSPKNIQQNITEASPTKTQPYGRMNKEHVDDVVLYIRTAIEKKQKKGYPDQSILIVSFDSDTLMVECDGDYSHLEQKIETLEKGIFSSIYLIENFMVDYVRPKWQFLL